MRWQVGARAVANGRERRKKGASDDDGSPDEVHPDGGWNRVDRYVDCYGH
jgi:hypothetical protein